MGKLKTLVGPQE